MTQVDRRKLMGGTNSVSSSPEGDRSLPVCVSHRSSMLSRPKPGGRYTEAHFLHRAMCRPPGFNTLQLASRWFTPPAKICRPPGLRGLCHTQHTQRTNTGSPRP